MKIIYIFISIFFGTLHAAQQEELGFYERPFISEKDAKLIRRNFLKKNYLNGKTLKKYPYFFTFKNYADCKKLGGEYEIVRKKKILLYPEPFSKKELERLNALSARVGIPPDNFEPTEKYNSYILGLFNKLNNASEKIKKYQEKGVKNMDIFSVVTEYLNLAKKLTETGVKINKKSCNDSSLIYFPITLSRIRLRNHFRPVLRYSLELLLSNHSDPRYIES
jgi:hypothetical protein